MDFAGIIAALRAPELNSRAEQIDPQSSHTFHWVFDDPSVGLCHWLQHGSGAFWISGKPGSGKSTLMKFIHHDPRTTELMHQWNSTSRQVKVSFFFHYRGTALQKSFEGLLRGIITQLLDAQPELLAILRSSLSVVFNQRSKQRHIDSLREDLTQLMRTCQLGTFRVEGHDIEDIIKSQDPLSSLRKSLSSFSHSEYVSGFEFVETDLSRRRDLHLQQGRVPREQDFLDCECWARINTLDPDVFVSKWLGELDLNAKLRKFLEKCGLEVVKREPDIQFHSNIEKGINKVLQTQERREQLSIEIQDGEWSKQRLEDIFRQICAQDLFDLDLCLFLDALDEYDGRPEFVSRFLKVLSEEEAFPRTKVKVLFSSRPWTIFQEEFAGCPGFKIHDHTKEDMCQNLALMANCGDCFFYCCCSVEENLWPAGFPIAKPATSANGSNCLYKLTICATTVLCDESGRTKFPFSYLANVTQLTPAQARLSPCSGFDQVCSPLITLTTIFGRLCHSMLDCFNSGRVGPELVPYEDGQNWSPVTARRMHRTYRYTINDEQLPPPQHLQTLHCLLHLSLSSMLNNTV